MKHILVCVKAVPATTSVQVDGQFRLKREGTSLQWNIADESALEAAFRLRDKDGTVTVLTMGPPKLEAPLRDLLARGCDRAVLVTDPLLAGADTRATAFALKTAAEQLGPFDLVLCGRRAIDGETGQVPGELAAALGIPCVSNVEKLAWEEDRLILTRRLETGVEILSCTGPLVVSVCEYACPLRLPSILSLRRARAKQVALLHAADLGLTAEQCGLKGSLTKVTAMESKFPGLRRGPKETDMQKGADTIRAMLREVTP